MWGIRTVGRTAGFVLVSFPDAVGKRGYSAMEAAFHDNDLMLRIAGDTLALTPRLIVNDDQVGEIVSILGDAIEAAARELGLPVNG